MDQRLPELAVTDWRGLCEELVDELHGYASANPHHDSDALVARARAALAQPEAEVAGPSDQELKTFACKWWNKFGFTKNKATCTWVIDEICPDHFVDFSRDLLARWGRPAPVPAGEVRELVAWLRDRAESTSLAHNALRITRAADLLEQRHPAPCSPPRPIVRRGAMADLSPAAQAVLDAAEDDCIHPVDRHRIAAAALRAAADHAVPEAANAVGDQHDEARLDQWLRIRWNLLAIAAELERGHG